ncbi:hypothetical protein JOC75_001905 [Metabacillus crassostreae]|nr:hypothetical protein [Metabacillus crassostreae]
METFIVVLAVITILGLSFLLFTVALRRLVDLMKKR